MSIFSIGLSGLNAARNAFQTSSNNISNVYTPGYNREVTVLGEQNAAGGVKVQDIQRQFDRYVASQLNSANSKSNGLQAYQTQVSQIDNLLADQDAGLAPLMQKFFSSVSDLTNSPSDPAARQGVIGSADTLSAQFRSFDQYLSDMATGVDGQVRDEVKQINNNARQIAQLNKQIILATAKQGKAPNSLLNQRDHLVSEMAKRVDIDVNVQDGGSYNISIGNGQPLVSGEEYFSLGVKRANDDPTRSAITYNDSAGNQVELADSSFEGGTLGGLLAFRNESLDPTRSKLGQLAVSFAQAVNQVQHNGLDVDGNPGQDMFGIGAPEIYSDSRNLSAVTASAVFDPANGAALTASDYQLRWDDGAGQFQVTELDSGDTFTATPDANNQLHFGGVEITLSDPTQLADGDRFRLNPTRTAAGGFENVLAGTDAIAAAGPTGGAGNNENALAMEDLQTATTVGGNASFAQAYASLVSQVGSRTNIVQVNLEASQSLSEQLSAVQQSESGVNLDEESVNLVRFQQYYQANAKVIQTASQILDSILRIS